MIPARDDASNAQALALIAEPVLRAATRAEVARSLAEAGAHGAALAQAGAAALQAFVGLSDAWLRMAGRIAKDAALNPLTLFAEKFGTIIARSWSVRGSSAWIMFESTAVTAIGVVCRFEVRRCAVTTTSASPWLTDAPLVALCAYAAARPPIAAATPVSAQVARIANDRLFRLTCFIWNIPRPVSCRYSFDARLALRASSPARRLRLILSCVKHTRPFLKKQA